ncbi:MAG: hypothetical protein VYD05_09835, partial [Planctomycetota bacterium]|nr:hypothetical protein [Planctomycetota bacterium]
AAAAQAPAVAAPSRSAPPRPTAASPSPPTPTRPATPVAGSDELKARALARLSDRKLLQATLELCRFAGPDQNGRVSVTLETERKMYIDRIKSRVI